MKKGMWGLALLMALTIPARPASGAADAKDADSYNLTAHVSASQYAPPAVGSNDGNQVLTVTIAGKHYQLRGPTSSSKVFSHGNGLLNLGDYKVKLVEDTHKSVYESVQVYEFLLPDNSTRKFGVIVQSE
jgi:hypothetical protein